MTHTAVEAAATPAAALLVLILAAAVFAPSGVVVGRLERLIRAATTGCNRGADRPPRQAQTAPVALVGPGGWRIDQITITRGTITRTVLRVRRHGYFIAEVASVEQLLLLGVDITTLVDEHDDELDGSGGG